MGSVCTFIDKGMDCRTVRAEGHYKHVLQELETMLKCGQEFFSETRSSLCGGCQEQTQ